MLLAVKYSKSNTVCITKINDEKSEGIPQSRPQKTTQFTETHRIIQKLRFSTAGLKLTKFTTLQPF
jgi:hypothetical protein